MHLFCTCVQTSIVIEGGVRNGFKRELAEMYLKHGKYSHIMRGVEREHFPCVLEEHKERLKSQRLEVPRALPSPRCLCSTREAMFCAVWPQQVS